MQIKEQDYLFLDNHMKYFTNLRTWILKIFARVPVYLLWKIATMNKSYGSFVSIIIMSFALAILKCVYVSCNSDKKRRWWYHLAFVVAVAFFLVDIAFIGNTTENKSAVYLLFNWIISIGVFSVFGLSEVFMEKDMLFDQEEDRAHYFIESEGKKHYLLLRLSEKYYATCTDKTKAVSDFKIWRIENLKDKIQYEL